MKPYEGVEVEVKCTKCETENRTCAHYCIKCRYEFTEEEQNRAKNKNLEGIIVRVFEKVDKIKSFINLSFLTEKLWFQILSVVLVLGIGILSCFQNGIHLKILKSDAYQIYYHTKLNEYYLVVEEEKTQLNLYLPYQKQEITVKHMDLENELESNIYQDGVDIVLMSNEENDYYLITGKRLDRKEETLKVYVYKKGVVIDEEK